jgi:serine/threonine protein phosphatase 1
MAISYSTFSSRAMTESLAVLGDVHGDSERLRRALSACARLGRRIILVGDYVDRGPDSAGVLETLVQTRRILGSQLVSLVGNHELAMINYLETGDLNRFARFGGMATIRSYVGTAKPDVHRQFLEAVPDAHQRLLREQLEPFLETDTVLVSHTGWDPSHPDDRRTSVVCRGHPRLFEWAAAGRPLPRPVVVCGHYVQRGKRPYQSNGLFCLDTGCGTLGGPLTALLLPEREFLSF